MVEKFDWTASEMPGKFEAKFGDNCGTLTDFISCIIIL